MIDRVVDLSQYFTGEPCDLFWYFCCAKLPFNISRSSVCLIQIIQIDHLMRSINADFLCLEHSHLLNISLGLTQSMVVMSLMIIDWPMVVMSLMIIDRPMVVMSLMIIDRPMVDVTHDHRPAHGYDVTHDHRPAHGCDVTHDHRPAHGYDVTHDHRPAHGYDVTHDHS